MSVLAVVLLAVGCALCAVFLRQSRLPVAALLVALAGGCLVLLRLLPAFSDLLTMFFSLAEESGAGGAMLALLLKIVGIAYLAEFGAQLCRDASEGALALKIELAARIAILTLALPVAASVVRSVLSLLQ